MCGEGTTPESERVVDWSERRRACMYIWYSTCQLELEGGRRGRVCPCAAMSLSDVPSFACVRARPVHALCTLGLPVHRKSKARGNRLALRSGDEAHTLWCVLSLQWRGFLQQGAKGEDSRGELAPFPLRGLEMVSFVRQPCLPPPGPPSFLMCVLVFNTVRLQLSNQTKVNLCSQARMSVQLLKVYSFTLYMRQIITSTSWDVMETSLISCAAYQ